MHNEITQAIDQRTRVIARCIDVLGDSHTVHCRILENHPVPINPFGGTRIEPAVLQIIDHYSGFGAHGALLRGSPLMTTRGGDSGTETVKAELDSVAVDRESDALILLRAGYRVTLL